MSTAEATPVDPRDRIPRLPSMDLDALIGALAPGDVIGRRPVEFLDLAYDTGRVRDGTLFFCVPGARVDGHELAADAVAAGASALVVERPVDVAVTQLVVESTRASMAVARASTVAKCIRLASEISRVFNSNRRR